MVRQPVRPIQRVACVCVQSTASDRSIGRPLHLLHIHTQKAANSGQTNAAARSRSLSGPAYPASAKRSNRPVTMAMRNLIVFCENSSIAMINECD